MNATSEKVLLDFINQELLTNKEGRVDAFTPLFQEGWIDSLKILQLIAFLEVQRGTDIPDREVVMDRFQNVHSICEHFLQPKNEQTV
jgi:acyl carrier protein